MYHLLNRLRLPEVAIILTYFWKIILQYPTLGLSKIVYLHTLFRLSLPAPVSLHSNTFVSVLRRIDEDKDSCRRVDQSNQLQTDRYYKVEDVHIR